MWREEESGVWCQVDTHDRLLGEPELLLARGKFAIGCEWIENQKKNKKNSRNQKNQKIKKKSQKLKKIKNPNFQNFFEIFWKFLRFFQKM